MNSDIKLNENILILEADRVDVTAADIILDSPVRRKEGIGGNFRRALVHDETDGLTINFNGDYPGGVTIMGREINLPGLDKPAATPVTDNSTSGIEINPNFTSPHDRFDLPKLDDHISNHIGQIKIKLPVDISTMFDEIESPVNLLREIRRLRQAVITLDKRVKELEARG
jgi:hypothetical protein